MADKDIQDPYAYPGSKVLINKMGLTRQLDLTVVEQRITAYRMLQLRQQPIKGDFDLVHLKATHKHILQDIYPWAGEFRTCGIQKEQSVFAGPQYLEPEGKRMLQQLTQDVYVQAKEKAVFVDRITSLFSDLNALHPFREGNGRTQRAFISAYASHLGYAVDWQQVNSAQMRDISLETFHGKEYKARGVFEKIIDVTPRNKVVQETLDKMVQKTKSKGYKLEL